LGVNLVRIVSDATAAERPAEADRQRVSPPTNSSHRKRGWAHHQDDGDVLDFVNSEFSAASFLSALRFLVTVWSDLSCRGSVLKAFFSKFLRWP
jgi:hypothetical protein